MSRGPASNCPVTGLISNGGRESNDCDKPDMLLSLFKDNFEEETDEDLSPVSVEVEDDDEDDDEDLGTGLKVTADVGGGGGIKPGPDGD